MATFLRCKKKSSKAASAPFEWPEKGSMLRQGFKDGSRRSFKIDLKFRGKGCASETYLANEDEHVFDERRLTQDQISQEMAVRFGYIDPSFDHLEEFVYDDVQKDLLHHQLEKQKEDLLEQDPEPIPFLNGSVKQMHRPDDRDANPDKERHGMHRKKELRHRNSAHDKRRARVSKTAGVLRVLDLQFA